MEIIELKESILADNDADAAALREELTKKGIFYINVMSSPGSGKTTTLCRIIEELKDSYSLGVMEADIDSDVDANTIAALDIPCVQLHTGGMCHLDAQMSRQGLAALSIGTKGYEVDASSSDAPKVVFLENIGNLVCPAEFDTGAHLNIVILSVPEGDDKPIKYPLMFQVCDIVLINKIDTLPVFDFDIEAVKNVIHKHNKKAVILPISSLKNEGITAFTKVLSDSINAKIH